MKNTFIYLAFFTLAISVHSTEPEVKVLYNHTFPSQAEYIYTNDLYYFNSVIYNSTSGAIMQIGIPAGCAEFPEFTLDLIPLCYGYQNSSNETITFQLHYLNAYMNESTEVFNVTTFPEDSYVLAGYTNGYIIVELINAEDMIGSSLAVFDLESKEIVCQAANFNPLTRASTVYTDGNILISGSIINGNARYVIQNCSVEANITADGPRGVYSIDIYGFNNSAVFINAFVIMQNDESSLYIQTAVFDQKAGFKFGNPVNVTNFIPYNDTHFILIYSPDGNLAYGLYTINSALQFQQVLNLDLGIPGFIPDPSLILGTSYMNLVIDGVYITYDISQGQVIEVNSFNPPIFLSNGSSVNFTQYGYFIHNPDGPYYFIVAPYSNPGVGIYQDPSDLNQYYTLFIPSQNFMYYPNCLLTHYNITSSQILLTTFPVCPLTAQSVSSFNIKDVQFDSNGSPNVAYRDLLGAVFVVNVAGSNGPIQATYLYSVVQLSLFLQNQTINFVGTQLTNFMLGQVSIINGTVFHQLTVKTDSLYNTIYKVDSQYFMLAHSKSSSSMSTFSLWDVSNLILINQVSSHNYVQFYSTTPFFIVGFNPASPANYSGVVYWSTKEIYIVNVANQTLKLIPGSGISINDLVPVSGTLFMVSQYMSVLNEIALFEVGNWDIQAQGSKQNEDAEEKIFTVE